MDLFYLLDNVRKEYARSLIIATIIGAGIIIPYAFVIADALAAHEITSVVIIASVTPALDIVLIATFVIYNFRVVRKNRHNYRSHYKAYFIKPALAQTFTNLYYNHDMGISKGLINLADAINTGDRVTSNDYVSGKYKDVGFTQADIKIEEKHRDLEGDTYYATIFKGRYMIFEFPKKFSFKLRITQKFFRGKKHGFLSNLDSKYTRISTESGSFNQKFTVHAEDGFEAYYILGPDLIDRIETLSNNIKGKIMLAFTDNKLHVAIRNNKDAFEPPNPFVRINKEIELYKVRQDIGAITDFVDQLKLNSKLFTN